MERHKFESHRSLTNLMDIDAFSCSICFESYNEDSCVPYGTSCCDFVLCQSCVLELSEDEKIVCPVCRASVLTKSLIKSRHLLQIIRLTCIICHTIFKNELRKCGVCSNYFCIKCYGDLLKHEKYYHNDTVGNSEISSQKLVNNGYAQGMVSSSARNLEGHTAANPPNALLTTANDEDIVYGDRNFDSGYQNSSDVLNSYSSPNSFDAHLSSQNNTMYDIFELELSASNFQSQNSDSSNVRTSSSSSDESLNSHLPSTCSSNSESFGSNHCLINEFGITSVWLATSDSSSDQNSCASTKSSSSTTDSNSHLQTRSSSNSESFRSNDCLSNELRITSVWLASSDSSSDQNSCSSTKSSSSTTHSSSLPQSPCSVNSESFDSNHSISNECRITSLWLATSDSSSNKSSSSITNSISSSDSFENVIDEVHFYTDSSTEKSNSSFSNSSIDSEGYPSSNNSSLTSW